MPLADPALRLPTDAIAPTPPAPLKAGLAAEWLLDPAITYLNHGSFGARPRAVLEAQRRWSEQFEARPIEFLHRRNDELSGDVKRQLASFLRFDPRDVGFVTNASEGVNAVLRSLTFKPGDELLTTSHVYNAVRKAMRYVADRTGAVPREVHVPLPVHDAEAFTRAIAGAITPRTRLLIVDHVTSPTALVLPIQSIVRACNEADVDVLVDGAHAPGMIDVNIESLRPVWYTANLHKWVCGPPSSAVLWVKRERQNEVHPTVISHHYGEGFLAEFGWQGTRDISPLLAAGDAMTYMHALGWDRVRAHNHALAVWAQHLLCERWRVEPASPIDGRMIGSMCTVALPTEVRSRFATAQDAQACLYREHDIEIPVVEWGDAWWVRASCQIYNAPAQYERLADAVLKLAGRR